MNARTAQLVDLLTELGPDVPEIARRLGQFKESVRYRYKEKIINRGLAVQGIVDHEKLGLRRIGFILDFASEYRQYAQSILAAMNELCYLVGFSRTLPKGEYVVFFSVPVDVANEIVTFFMSLKEKGMFDKVEPMEFDWFTLAPMRSDCYDFDTGRWEYDWSSPPAKANVAASQQPSTPSKFDYVDLLILKELQMDANKSLKEIADKLNLNYKKLAWHYSAHVKAKHLVRGFSVAWMGSKYDYKIEKALHRQHRYVALQLLVRNVTPFEMISLRQDANKVPFLWAEMMGKNYYAEFFFPLDFVVEGMQWLSGLMAPVRDRADLFTIDYTGSLQFSIPYTLFDQSQRKWKLEPTELMQRFDNLIVQIKSGAS
ncbi:MAG TPA: hypothetical protein VEC02_04615 [Nitrososphaerales archaeon]|nr:hypothetical protein [Nitrososphaerales archaeon]